MLKNAIKKQPTRKTISSCHLKFLEGWSFHEKKFTKWNNDNNNNNNNNNNKIATNKSGPKIKQILNHAV